MNYLPAKNGWADIEVRIGLSFYLRVWGKSKKADNLKVRVMASDVSSLFLGKVFKVRWEFIQFHRFL